MRDKKYYLKEGATIHLLQNSLCFCVLKQQTPPRANQIDSDTDTDCEITEAPQQQLQQQKSKRTGTDTVSFENSNNNNWKLAKKQKGEREVSDPLVELYNKEDEQIDVMELLNEAVGNDIQKDIKLLRQVSV